MSEAKQEWFAKGTAGHESHGQWAVYDESGKSIAIVYDGKAHAALIARAPSLLAENERLREALELAQTTVQRLTVNHGQFSSTKGTLDVIASALSKP